MNSSSNGRGPQNSGLGLIASIQILLGRILVWTGGRTQEIGATLIETAHEGRASRFIAYALAGAVVALYLVICALDANAGLTINRLNAPMRATAY